jgi:hypothetical protein
VHQLIQSAIGIGLSNKDFLSLFAQQAQGAGILPVAACAADSGASAGLAGLSQRRGSQEQAVGRGQP